MDNQQTNWRALAAAPHRFFFATGLFFMTVLSGWWLLILFARQQGTGILEPQLPGLFMHGSVMLFLVFTPFMFGFLLTVFPRWQAAPGIPPGLQVASFGLLHLALPLVLLGMYAWSAVLLLGWSLVGLAWASLVAGFAWSWWRCQSPVVHSTVVLLGLACGLVGVLGLVFLLAVSNYAAWPWISAIGMWGFLLPIYFAVCHRMIPFFTSRVVTGYIVWRPNWMLWLFTLMAIARIALQGIPELRVIPVFVMLAIALALSVRWWPRERHGNRLLAVLHISFAWLVFALLLHFARDLGMIFLDRDLLGRAPLHALGFGFFGSMLIAMITRVTMGHSGRPLVMDRKGWWIFVALQVAAIARILAELLPLASSEVLLFSAATWVGVFLTWGARYAGIYFRPRVDGKPG